MIVTSIVLASVGFVLSVAAGIVAFTSGIRPTTDDLLYTVPRNGVVQLLLSFGVALTALAGALLGLAAAG